MQSKISKDDKYPSWDGEILVFNANNHKKSDLEGRVYVQVKSSKRKWKDRESYSLSKHDLRNYFNDGGIILIRPIYIKTITYKIFAKILLPVDIKKILDKNKSDSKKVSIKLKKYNEIKDFEDLCKHYIKHKKLQSSGLSINLDKITAEEESKLLLSPINSNNIETLLDDTTYFYIEGKYGELLPTNLELTKISKKENLEVKIKDKVYFNSISKIYQKDNEFKISFNSALSLEIKQQKINFNISINDDVIANDILIASNFLNDVTMFKEVYFGKEILIFNPESKLEVDERTINVIKNILKLLDKLKIDKTEVTIRDINNDFEKLNILSKGIVYNEIIRLKEKKEILLKHMIIFGYEVLLFLKKNNDNYYSIIDFMDNIIPNCRTRDYDSIACSQFTVLLSCFEKGLASRVNLLLRYKKSIIQDLKSFYKQELNDEYILLVLEIIKGFDIYKSIEILNISKEINNMINETNEYYSLICKINNYQIKYRKDGLNNLDIEELIDIKNNNINNIKLVCSVLLLIDNFREFEIFFNKLNDNDKSEFTSWPIYNLYKKNKGNI